MKKSNASSAASASGAKSQYLLPLSSEQQNIFQHLRGVLRTQRHSVACERSRVGYWAQRAANSKYKFLPSSTSRMTQHTGQEGGLGLREACESVCSLKMAEQKNNL